MNALCLYAVVAIVLITLISGGGAGTAGVWRAEDRLLQSVLCFHRVGSGDPARVLCLQSHLTNPRTLAFRCCTFTVHTEQADETIKDHLTGKEAEVLRG